MRQPHVNHGLVRPDLRLLAWMLALVGYFGPWIAHQAAVLAWNAYDLFDILRFLPQIETFALRVNLYMLRLPLVGLAVLLPWLLARQRPGWRWAAGGMGIALVVATFPPYPEIITAWRTPGWGVPFWWGVGALFGVLLGAGAASRCGRWRPWLILVWILFTGIPAFITFNRLLPALSVLYHAPLHPGWGYWLYAAGLALLAAGCLFEGMRSAKGTNVMNTTTEDRMARVRAVKKRYEKQLLRKANVIGVGIGVRQREDDPTEEVILVVNVTHKVAKHLLAAKDLIPEELSGIPVKVQAIGKIKAQIEASKQPDDNDK